MVASNGNGGPEITVVGNVTSETPAIPGLPTPITIEQKGDALVSTNFRWDHPDGWENIQTTVRHGASLDDVMDHLDTVMGALEMLSSQGIKPPTSVRGTPSVAPAPGKPIPDDFCQIHNVTMKKYERDGKVWYAHKEGDIWCNEKDRKAAGYDH
jgi:hypothetical protein